MVVPSAAQPLPDLGRGRNAAGADDLVVDDEARRGEHVVREDLVDVRDLHELGVDARAGRRLARDRFQAAAVGTARAEDLHGGHACFHFNGMERDRRAWSAARAIASRATKPDRPSAMGPIRAPSTHVPYSRPAAMLNSATSAT